MHFDVTPFYKSTVGFDRVFSLLDSLNGIEGDNGYPPYNIERVNEDEYRITMAVAGFGENDLEIRTVDNKLVITGRIEKGENSEERSFLHRGIAERAFERQFSLADHVKVVDASLENGLLHVDLAREVPEAMKPRTITIKSSDDKSGKARQIESNAA